MQVGRLASDGLHRLLNEAQSVVECLYQLWCDNIVAQRLICFSDAFGQLEDEVTLVHSLWYGDQVFNQFHAFLTFLALIL